MKHLIALIHAIVFVMILLAGYIASEHVGYWNPELPEHTQEEYC